MISFSKDLRGVGYNLMIMLLNVRDCSQAAVKYNIPDPEDLPAFKIDVSVDRREPTDGEEATVCYPLLLNIAVKYVI